MLEFGRAFNWNVIERELVDHDGRLADVRPEAIALDPPAFKLETGSLWTFKQRGTWGMHDSRYRGNWAPEVPRNLIERFCKPGALVFDAFSGGGTTILEAIALGRRAYGTDVSARAVRIANHKANGLAAALKLHRRAVPDWRIVLEDARALSLEDGSVDLICAHPPYLDIIAYTRDDARDLSRYQDPTRFIAEFRKVVAEMHRVLKVSAFNLREVIIKEQPTSAMKQYWSQKKRARFFYQIAHEYLFILEKPTDDSAAPTYIHAL
jgi:16S rRNA G966 N2-methylase RsmD